MTVVLIERSDQEFLEQAMTEALARACSTASTPGVTSAPGKR